MSNKIILVVILIVVAIGIGYWISQSQKEVGQSTGTQEFALDPKDCTYIIEGKNITLTNGYSEEEIIPGLSLIHI